MSLRRRLFTLLLVACVALATFVVGVTHLVNRGVAAREATAASVGRRAMLALAHRLDDGLPLEGPELDGVLDDLSRTVGDGTVGLCDVDGRIGRARTVIGSPPFDDGPHGPPPEREGEGEGEGPPEPAGGMFERGPPPGAPPFRGGDRRMGGRAPRMLPLDERGVEGACRTATAEARSTRALAPTDILRIATLRTRAGTGPVAFALAHSPRSEERGAATSLAFLAFGGAITAVLLALTAHGAWVLRASTRSLQASVDALKRDLRAPIEEPRATELADLAGHLRTLASTLADTQARERALVRDVEDQKRLAGLGRVVAGVAHEVRNPLAGIKLRLDSMSLRALDERTRVDVERCLREVARLDRLVRTLLLAARKRAVERAPFEASVFLEERIALAAPLAEPKGVVLQVEGDATIHAEREGLSGAFDNLLRNAIEASPEGGVVRVVVRREGDAVRLDTLDEGPGIAPAREGELFEPFFTTKSGGTGLGLVLARATLEAHGGSIEYARRDGRTVFSMRVPDGPSARSVTHDGA